MKQYNRIDAAVESLDAFPERCKLFDSEPELPWRVAISCHNPESRMDARFLTCYY